MGSTDTEMNWTKDHRHQPTSSEHTLAQRREHPYIWATWLPRSADRQELVRMGRLVQGPLPGLGQGTPSEFNQAEWLLNHTALLNKRKADWELSHHSVSHRAAEQLPAPRKISNAGGPARPDHAAGRSSGHRRREDRAGGRQSRRTGDDLPVRHPESTGAVPDSQTQGAGHIR